MRLSCSFCHHSFQSAFGPPNVRCPKCGSGRVVHLDELGGVPTFSGPGDEPAAAMPPQQRLHVPRSAFEPPADWRRGSQESLDTLPWLAASVVLAVFCQPVGLAGLYYSDQANTLARRGRMDEARSKFVYAKSCVLGGFALLAIAITIGVALVMLE